MKGGVRVTAREKARVQDRTRARRRRRRWAFRKEGVGSLASRDSDLLVGGWCLDRLRRLLDGGVVLHGSLLPLLQF